MGLGPDTVVNPARMKITSYSASTLKMQLTHPERRDAYPHAFIIRTLETPDKF